MISMAGELIQPFKKGTSPVFINALTAMLSGRCIM